MLNGVPRAEIATRLGLAPGTVNTAIGALLRLHECKTVTVLVCRLWAARCVELQTRIKRLEQGERRKGQVERRLGPD